MNCRRPSLRHHGPAQQRGVVLIFTLIILVILMIGAVALVRSMSASLVSAGNLAFRRDLVNQGEAATSAVLKQFETGALVGNTAANVPASNYSATMLATNAQGVPSVLLNDTAFATQFSAADITGATADIVIRYVIDRLCTGSGTAAADMCVQANAAPAGGGNNGSYAGAPVAPPSSTVFRVTVRVLQTARNTEVFMQNTFAEPN